MPMGVERVYTPHAKLPLCSRSRAGGRGRGLTKSMSLTESLSDDVYAVSRRQLRQSEARLLLESLSPAVKISDLVLGPGRNRYVREALRREIRACHGVVSRERYHSMLGHLDDLDGRESGEGSVGTFKRGTSG